MTFDNKLGGLKVLLHYAQQKMLLEGLPLHIAQYEIAEAQIDKNKQTTKIRFEVKITNNINNIPIVEEANVLHEYK